MRKLVIILTLNVLLLLTSACGFKPLYSKDNNVNVIHDLAAIQVFANKGKSDQELANIIEDELNPGLDFLDPKYQLSFTYDIAYTPALVQKNSEVTRFNVVLTFYYSLHELETFKEKSIGKIVVRDSYDTVRTSNYATIVEKNNATRNINREVARELKRRLIIAIT